jgi:hypothetical protein
MKKFVIPAALAVAVCIVGVVYAAIPNGSTIQGCYQKNHGQLRVVENAAECQENSEVPLAWSQQGPKGDKGDKGDKGEKGEIGLQGPAGPQGPTYNAGVGLDLLETPPPFETHLFGITQAYRLPQGCSAGAVPEKSGNRWICGGSGGAGASHAYIAHGTHDLGVPNDSEVASLTLPAGSYLIIGKATLITSDPDEQPAHCSLSTGDVAEMWLHEGGEPVGQSVTVLDAANFDADTVVRMMCGAYESHARGVLTAISVGAVN